MHVVQLTVSLGRHCREESTRRAIQMLDDHSYSAAMGSGRQVPALCKLLAPSSTPCNTCTCTLQRPCHLSLTSFSLPTHRKLGKLKRFDDSYFFLTIISHAKEKTMEIFRCSSWLLATLILNNALHNVRLVLLRIVYIKPSLRVSLLWLQKLKIYIRFCDSISEQNSRLRSQSPSLRSMLRSIE